MLNRNQILAAIQAQIDSCAGTGKRFAVQIVRVRGLRDISLRFGWERGAQADEDARMLIGQSLRPIDQVFHSGDESFTVLLPDMLSQNHVLLATTRLVKAFEQPLNSATSPWHGRPTMGVAFFPDHGADADQLCRRAEIAVDEAQRLGERSVFYRPMGPGKEIFYEELREAIELNRLRAYFQPVVNLKTRRVVGAESLARWNSPLHGEVEPAEFVQFAERSDLIWALTRWSINATLRHAAALGGRQDFTFAINLSTRVFTKPGLVEQLLDALQIWGLPPSTVVAEITETALVNDLDMTVRVLRRLRDHGMRIAVDDFGTGYSSIAYLSRFPATELKIDKSLTGAIQTDARTTKLVHGLINLAHEMDLMAIAEGVEDQVTQDMLTEMGCDFAQGYHLGRPEPAADFVARFAPEPAPL
ncbi:MAG: GGDEF domain-containing phosphodiesterase [Rudaea sp.]|nr:GGDEF domain-containing phosphodiesterase [Rudaea sp.]